MATPSLLRVHVRGDSVRLSGRCVKVADGRCVSGNFASAEGRTDISRSRHRHLRSVVGFAPGRGERFRQRCFHLFWSDDGLSGSELRDRISSC
jgi:hypothetical protein